MLNEISVKEKITVQLSSLDLVSQILKENTFPNPKFLSNQKHGYYNGKTQEHLCSYVWKDGSLHLRRGYLQNLLKLCKSEGLEVTYSDSHASQPVSFPILNAKLRPYQTRVVTEVLMAEEGVIVSPTGSGKSIIGLEIIRQRKEKALIIVHRSDLAAQWVKVIEDRLGIKASLIGNGHFQVGEFITVAMIQTLVSKEKESKNLSDTFGIILVDEVHHVPAESFSEVLGWMNPKYLYGLSATLNRRDGLENIIYRSIGPIISYVDRSEVEDGGATVPLSVFALKTGFDPGEVTNWHEYLDSLTLSDQRNGLIIDISQEESSPVLILCDRINHAEKISSMMIQRGIKHILAHGQLRSKEKAEAMESLKTAQITIGTTSLLGEGLDVSSWEILIMASPISSETKLMQALGRIVRPSKGKTSGRVYDLKDECGFSGSSFNNRFEIYRKNRIWVNFE